MLDEEDIHRWDEAAERYAATVGGDGDSFYRRLRPFLEEQLGAVDGQRVLDLGCGHGWLAAVLAGRGAQVVGVDGSTALIDIARRQHPSIRFAVADLTLGLPPGLGTFDAVVSHMVLMDLPSIDALLRDTAASLSPGGVFVVSLLHPSFFGQDIAEEAMDDGPRWHRQVRGYLEHQEWWIDSFGGHRHYHRPLSWYVNAAADAGLAVTALHEPPSLPAHAAEPERWTAHERWFATIPTMLAFAARPRSVVRPAR